MPDRAPPEPPPADASAREVELVLEAVAIEAQAAVLELLTHRFGYAPAEAAALLKRLPIGLVVVDLGRAERWAGQIRRMGAMASWRAVPPGAPRCHAHRHALAVRGCPRCGAPMCAGCGPGNRRCSRCRAVARAWTLGGLGVGTAALAVVLLRAEPGGGPTPDATPVAEMSGAEGAILEAREEAEMPGQGGDGADEADEAAGAPVEDPEAAPPSEAAAPGIDALRAALAAGDPAEAARVGREALAAARETLEIRALTGLLAEAAEAARQQGQLDAAVLLAETGLGRPSLAEDALHTTAALALVDLGRPGDAKAHFAHISELFPRYDEVKAALDATGVTLVEVDCARQAARLLGSKTRRSLRGYDQSASAHFKAYLEDDHVNPPAERIADFLEDLEVGWSLVAAELGDPGGGPIPAVFYSAEEFARRFRVAAGWIPAGVYVVGEGFLSVNLYYAYAPTETSREIMAHEVAHAMLRRLAGGAGLPEWLNEGLASVYGYRRIGRPALTAQAWTDLGERRLSLTPLGRLCVHQDDPRPIYDQSAAAATLLLERTGATAVREYLAQRCHGRPHEDAFAASFGVSELALDAAFSAWLGERWGELPTLTPGR